MSERKDYEMTEDDLAKIMKASEPVPMIALQCGTPRSPQETANEAWKELGGRMGFDHMTVLPTHTGNRFFTAVPVPVESVESDNEEIPEKDPTGRKAVDRLTEAAKPLIKYLNENHHPHTKIIVEPTGVEVLESLMGNPKKYDFLKD